MEGSIHKRGLAAAALLSGALAAGCGASSPSQTASTARTVSAANSTVTARTTSTTSTTPGPSSGGGQASAGSPGLAFAKCMRATGVPNFPDPSPGQGLRFPQNTGDNPGSPAFKAAQAKCMKLLGEGPPGPGSTTHPSAQTLAKLLRIARCMRQHGVPQFPDPQTTVPSNPAGEDIREITDFDGAILLFPGTIDIQAPAYRQALTACGAPPLGLPH